ncbi:hypothetical protein CW712_01365 [Candidatus Bathyarchaeota archaeon]|nr:MAG: hypothetical protein CW712_01365 [Candidatus Bathyarchaeota archaeon]
MSSEERGRSSYLDLLITTLMEHEKNLDALVEKLEKTCKDLKNLYNEVSSNRGKARVSKGKSEAAPSDQGSIIYMKIKTDREIDEIIKIIESLKE